MKLMLPPGFVMPLRAAGNSTELARAIANGWYAHGKEECVYGSKEYARAAQNEMMANQIIAGHISIKDVQVVPYDSEDFTK